MNAEKLKQLQEQVRIGGKGSARRKKKVVHHALMTDDKKLQSTLKKLGVNNIPGIEEVNLIRDNGDIIHFNNPKVQGSLSANTFTVSGHAESKSITEMFPSILSQLSIDQLRNIKRLITTLSQEDAAAAAAAAASADSDAAQKSLMDLISQDDEVPTLVENFDEPSNEELTTAS